MSGEERWKERGIVNVKAEGIYAIRVQFLSERVRSGQSDDNSRTSRSETRIKNLAESFRIEECNIQRPAEKYCGLEQWAPRSGREVRRTVTPESLPNASSTVDS
jgi:hypothetical protein